MFGWFFIGLEWISLTSVYQVKCHSTLFVNKLLLFTRLDNIRQVKFNLKKNSSHLVIFFNLINHFILITLYCPFGSSVIIKCINTQQINKRYNLPLLSTIKDHSLSWRLKFFRNPCGHVFGPSDVTFTLTFYVYLEGFRLFLLFLINQWKLVYRTKIRTCHLWGILRREIISWKNRANNKKRLWRFYWKRKYHNYLNILFW